MKFPKILNPIKRIKVKAYGEGFQAGARAAASVSYEDGYADGFNACRNLKPKKEQTNEVRS